jgi:arylsulfatase A-like enzyme
VGLSATDYIGHRWGPDSREIHDQLLRLDHWLGWFLDSLATVVPPDRIVVVLTADHGVTSFPEIARMQGRAGGRIPLDAFVREVNLSIGRVTGDSGVLHAAPGLIYGDTARLRSLRVSPESLATILAPRVWKIPGVVTAWTPATLGGASPRDVHAVRWWRALPRGLSWLVCAVARPGYVWGNSDHGTTNPDDVDVPIIFMGPTIQPGMYPDTVRTTDIAPTLARVLGVKPDAKLDGRAIKRVLKSSATRSRS